MKIRSPQVLLIFLFLTASITLVFAWGQWGHKHISRAAVFALPENMRKFYYNHIDFITENAVIPDLRRAIINDKNESPRHYINIEDFGKISFSSLPKTTKEAFIKYDSVFLNKTGYLPWYIQTLTEKLTAAFRRRNKSEILFISSELSHYIADAHQPLHPSSNYDGQLTNQKGIHALWESFIPQKFGNAFNFKTDTARYIADIAAETWKIIRQSHVLVGPLLVAEKKVRNSFPQNKMYKKDTSGETAMFYNSPVFSDAYAKQFYTALNGMVEQQLRLSIYEVACFWYTAWVNAGKPNLISLDDPQLTKQNSRNYKIELKAWENGKILNLSVDKE